MTARKLLILGATGGTGRQTVTQALKQGHAVTAFVRNPATLNVTHDRLRVIAGDVTAGVGPLADAVRGQDAVISALGVGASLKSGGLLARSVPAILAAMEKEGVHRLVLVSAYGVGATRIDVPLLPSLFIRLALRDVYADKTIGDEAVRRSSLDWTLVYPTTLTNGPGTGRYRVGERLPLRGFPTVSRADVAHFLLTQLDDATYLRKSVLVSQ